MSNINMPDDAFKHLSCDSAGAKHRRCADKGKHRGFNADSAIPAVNNCINASVKVIQNMLSAGRARFSGKVRARCRNRNAGRTNQSKCGFMLRHTHRNGGEPRRDLRRDNVAFEIDHGERTRPECIRKLPRLVRNMFPKLFEVAFFCNMKNKRVVSGASLCSKNLFHSTAVKPVCTESVYGFGRKRNKPARANDSPAHVCSVLFLCCCIEKFRVHAAKLRSRVTASAANRRIMPYQPAII